MESVPTRVDGFLPLQCYAFLADGCTGALVGADGAVDWWPLPAMDDAPAFGALLDPGRGGRCTLHPTAPFTVSRRYVDGTLVTEFRTADGTVTITDALTVGEGGLLPWRELARLVEAVDGAVELVWEVRPGDLMRDLAAVERVVGDVPVLSLDRLQFALVLDGVGKASGEAGGFSGRFVARPGRPALLAVVAGEGEPTPVPDPAAVRRRVAWTRRQWAAWTELVDYDGPWRDSVVRSAVVHKQLTLAESGGLQAAATTSLPEAIGGDRNYDYRFCWVRDTAFAAGALTRLGLRGEVHAILSFLLRSVTRTAPDVAVLYGMRGQEISAQTKQVPLWSGYRDSEPVQVGNSAAGQRQLGVYGDLMEAVERYVASGNILDGGTARLVLQVADQICEQWTEPDAGLWELGTEQHYTISKIGCWAALDRAVRLAEIGAVPDDAAPRWRRAAQEIREYVDRNCWSATKNSYTFYAGTDDLDAATLLAARTDFSGPEDPRLHGTIEAVRRELGAGGPLLYRYTDARGAEGAFLACSFWLVDALVHIRQLEEARRLMDEAVDLANDVGLLSEQADPLTGALLGNMPQALSHLALINAACSYAACAT